MEYKHFSHSHNLIIHRIYELGQQVNCSGCESPCDNTKAPVHACHQCNFFLHDHCANAWRYIKHAAHESHPLNLYPYPTYASNTFFCEACGRPGKSFSYCCTLCEFDLHVGCAFLPFTVTHQAHKHQLTLFNKVPDTLHKYCNICKNVMDAKIWAYRCEICDICVHTCCATTEVAPELYREDSPVSAFAQGHGSKTYGGGGGGSKPHSWGAGKSKPHGGGGGNSKPLSVHTCATTEVAPELYQDDSPVSAFVQGHRSNPYGGGGGASKPHSWGGGKSKPHGSGGSNSKPHSGAGGGNVGRVDKSELYDMLMPRIMFENMMSRLYDMQIQRTSESKSELYDMQTQRMEECMDRMNNL